MSSSVSNLIGQFEGKQLEIAESRMAPRLARFLSLVWDNRAKPNLDIYELYSGGRPHGVVEAGEEPWDASLAEQFVSGLEGILREPEIQAYGMGLRLLYDHAEWFGVDAPTLTGLRRLARITQRPWIIRDLAKSFFHYRNGGSAALRVYLNVLPQHRAAFCRYLVANIVAKVPEVTNAKILGPLNLGLDTVVVYVLNQKGVDQVLQKVAAYQMTDSQAGYFGQNTVHLARPVQEFRGQRLKGAAVAIEPAVHAETMGLNRRPSFGDFWELLLSPILSETKDKGKALFLANVLERLRELEIDPMRPDL